MNSIEEIVQKAMHNGSITPSMEADISQLCSNVSQLSLAEHLALDQLMAACLSGEVTVISRKQFINVMEELVLNETLASISSLESSRTRNLDLGDITSYALNRLPPLYVTTEEGAGFQRERADKELQALIAEQVQEAIAKSISQPEFFPERHALTPAQALSNTSPIEQISALLQTYAANLNEEAKQQALQPI